MNDEPRDRFTEGLQRSLRDSEADIDELTLARLRAARAKTIDAAVHPRSLRWTVPVAVAAALVMTFSTVLYIQQDTNGMATADIALLEDLDMLGSNESLELLEDLEFYEWLAGHADKPV